MAVLQAHPRAALDGALHHLLGDGPLPLTERDGAQLFAKLHLLRKREEHRERVGARGEHEDERLQVVRVLEARGQVQRRRLDEARAQIGRDEILHAEHHLVGAHAAQHAECLEAVELVAPLAWDWHLLRIGRVEVCAPLGDVAAHGGRDADEGGQARERGERRPHLGREPLGRRVGRRIGRAR